MQQISSKTLRYAIGEMNKLSEFNDFIKGCKKRLTTFKKNPEFTYHIGSGGNRSSHTYRINVNDPFNKYLNLLEENISKIIICDEKELLEWKIKFNFVFSGLYVFNEDIKKGFFKRINTILQYEILRSGEDMLLFHFFSFLNQKVCVYCNSQHTILLKKSGSARFQADHNLPKSKYPCFSVSLSNLYPSCNNCNHHKLDKDLDFNLYAEKPNSEVQFSIPFNQLVLFLADNIKRKDLTLNFDQKKTKLKDVLKIDEIYENHKDYAWNTLVNERIYNDSYKNQLKASFKKLYGNDFKQWEKFIYGVSLDKNDINQQVFSKLILDIKDQLDKIKVSANKNNP